MQERRHKVRTRRPSMRLALGARLKSIGDSSPRMYGTADRPPVARGAHTAPALVCCAGSDTAGRQVGPRFHRQRGGGPLIPLPTPSQRELIQRALGKR